MGNFQYRRISNIPGDPEFWLFIAADAAVFTALFLVFGYLKAVHQQEFFSHQIALNSTLGFINTLILLTSSWFVALAFQFARRGNLKRAKQHYLSATMFGSCFVILKATEYSQKFSLGIENLTNTFYTYYFSMTGLHLFHVIIGMLCLLLTARRCYQTELSNSDLRFMESVGIYWHLVDVLWIFLFFQIYLLR